MTQEESTYDHVLPGGPVPMARKRREVLEYMLKQTEPQTRSDLLRGTGAGKSTVYAVIDALLDGNHLKKTYVERKGGIGNTASNISWGYNIRSASATKFTRQLKDETPRGPGKISKKKATKKKAVAKKKATKKKAKARVRSKTKKKARSRKS